MKATKGTILIPGLAILATAMAGWLSPVARADEVISRYPTTHKLPTVSVTLGATINKQRQDQRVQHRPDKKIERKRLSEGIDWERFLAGKLKRDSQEARAVAEQASVLFLSMVVVISYNNQPQTVISASSQTWQWQAWCWSNTTPSLPPPPVGTTINNVPEPTSLVSGLIGVGILGVSAWRRKCRQRQAK